MKNNKTSDSAIATVTLPVDASYIGKQLSVYYSEDDITWNQLGRYLVQDDTK
jgi:hypothetical protein